MLLHIPLSVLATSGKPKIRSTSPIDRDNGNVKGMVRSFRAYIELACEQTKRGGKWELPTSFVMEWTVY